MLMIFAELVMCRVAVHIINRGMACYMLQVSFKNYPWVLRFRVVCAWIFGCCGSNQALCWRADSFRMCFFIHWIQLCCLKCSGSGDGMALFLFVLMVLEWSWSQWLYFMYCDWIEIKELCCYYCNISSNWMELGIEWFVHFF